MSAVTSCSFLDAFFLFAGLLFFPAPGVRTRTVFGGGTLAEGLDFFVVVFFLAILASICPKIWPWNPGSEAQIHPSISYHRQTIGPFGPESGAKALGRIYLPVIRDVITDILTHSVRPVQAGIGEARKGQKPRPTLPATWPAT